MPEKKESAKVQCIILNKPFIGDYIFEKGQNAHEVINFFKADDGDQYIYNSPYGQNVSGAENYDIPYMVFTSGTKNGSFLLTYLIKIKKVLHTESISRTQIYDNDRRPSMASKEFVRRAKASIQSNLKEMNKGPIEYGGIPLDELFPDDLPAAPVTFIADKMYKAKSPMMIVEDELYYHFARNFGYVINYGDKAKAYEEIMGKIIDDKGEVNKANWEESPVDSFKEETDKYDLESMNDNLFLDFIDLHKEEECYKIMLAKILKESSLFGQFVDYLINEKVVEWPFYPHNEKWLWVESEKSYTGAGRIDIIAESEKARVVIENKIDSGINYHAEKSEDPEEKKVPEDQLNRYYRYFKNLKGSAKKETLYLVLAPKYSRDEIELEIKGLGNDVGHNWQIIDYDAVFNFVNEHKEDLKSFKFNKYIEDALLLFKRMSFDRQKLAGLKLTKTKIENEAAKKKA